MKTGFNLLLWTRFVTENTPPFFERLRLDWGF